ncbi:MAG: hypothetical protein V1678_03275 [Candidatus Aenigmatarchaeota archaeon]
MIGQSEIMVFVLLLVIGVSLFTSATIWSRDIFQQNVDVARVESAEKFMKDLNEDIQSIVKFGGSRELRYGLEGTIRIADSQTIEVGVPVTIPLTNSWVTISSDDSYYIRERLEGDFFKLQLNYTSQDYRIEFFTDGPTLSTPSIVKVERNQTTSTGQTVIKIKVTFS